MPRIKTRTTEPKAEENYRTQGLDQLKASFGANATRTISIYCVCLGKWMPREEERRYGESSRARVDVSLTQKRCATLCAIPSNIIAKLTRVNVRGHILVGFQFCCVLQVDRRSPWD